MILGKKRQFTIIFILLSIIIVFIHYLPIIFILKVIFTILILLISYIILLLLFKKKGPETFTGITENEETGIKLAEEQKITVTTEQTHFLRKEYKETVKNALSRLNNSVNTIIKSDTQKKHETTDNIVTNYHKSCLDLIMEIEKNSNEISVSAKQAFDISDNLAGTAKEAFSLSEKVQTGIQIVTDTLSDTLKQTNELYIQSHQITKVLDLMSDISSKTHVLSINASVVAARAGSHGKTFEVVAKEIRRLAEETESALKEIEILIRSIVKTISYVVEKTKLINKETGDEKSALMSVAGALQGVILAIEIIRTVSNTSQEKSQKQAFNTKKIISLMGKLLTELEDVKSINESSRVPELIKKLKTDCQSLELSLKDILN